MKFSISSLLLLIVAAAVVMAVCFRPSPELRLGDKSAYCVIESDVSNWIIYRLELENRTREPIDMFTFKFGNHELVSMSDTMRRFYQKESILLQEAIRPGEIRVIERIYLSSRLRFDTLVSCEAIIDGSICATEPLRLQHSAIELPDQFVR